MQVQAAQKILNWGYKLILTDRNEKSVCAQYADQFVPLDTFDVPGNLAAARALKKKYTIAAAVAIAADCHETVAEVGKSLNLPVIDPNISRRCRYKIKTREILSQAGIPQPRFKLVQSLSEAKSFFRKLKRPMAVKSTDNSGSRGFSKIEMEKEMTEEVFETARNSGTTGKVIVEELLVPVKNKIAEQSVETLWCDGKMYWLNWVDRLFRADLHFFPHAHWSGYQKVGWGVELGHINPAIHDPAYKTTVFESVYRAGVALGMKREKGAHILKADILLTEKGPFILELTPRLSGGWDSPASTPARGADFIGGAIQLALGKKLDLDLWTHYFEFKNPNLFSAVTASIKKGAQDCIDRKFALGVGGAREEALIQANQNLKRKRYVLSMVQSL